MDAPHSPRPALTASRAALRLFYSDTERGGGLGSSAATRFLVEHCAGQARLEQVWYLSDVQRQVLAYPALRNLGEPA